MSDREKYKRAARGDIAYNMMRLWQGAVGVVPTDGLVSPAYVVARPYPETVSPSSSNSSGRMPIRPRSISIHTALFQIEIGSTGMNLSRCRSAFHHLRNKQLSSVFLDHLDRKIRRFIQAKRRLVELLNEQKNAIVHKAVTRGLNPDVSLKLSGVSYLGELPEYWKVRRLGQIAKVFNGTNAKPHANGLLERGDHTLAVQRQGQRLHRGNTIGDGDPNKHSRNARYRWSLGVP